MDWTERMELEDLDRRLRDMPSTKEAEARLSNLQDAIEVEVKHIEAKIKECDDALKTPNLSVLERFHIAEKAQELAERLGEFRQKSDMKLRFASGLVRTCREWNPKRKRYQELMDRATTVERALTL